MKKITCCDWCGLKMGVPKEGWNITSKADGMKLYFCSISCKKTFDAEWETACKSPNRA